MTYQPLELGRRPPMFDAMDQLGQSIGELGNIRRQGQQYADQQKRQGDQDFEAAMAKAQAAYKARDFEGAVAYLAPYKSRLIKHHQDALGGGGMPVSPQGLPDGTPPGAGKIPPAPQMGGPQGGSPMPDGLENRADPYAAPPSRFGAPGPAPQENPLFAANDATRAREGARASALAPDTAAPPPRFGGQMEPAPGPQAGAPPQMGAAPGGPPQGPGEDRMLMAFTPPGGQETTIDMMAWRDRMREQNIAHVKEAFGNSPDPTVQKYYPQILAAASASDEPIKPMDILRSIHYSESTEQSGATAAAKAAEHAMEWDDRTKEWVAKRGTQERGQNMALEGKRVIGAAMGGGNGQGNPIKTNADNRGNAAALETAVGNVFKMAQGKALINSERTLHSVLQNASAEGEDAITAHKDAFLGLERVFRGGVPTSAEQELMFKHMGGISGAIQQYLADLSTGDFSDITKRNLVRASQLALQEQTRNVEDLMGAIRDRTGPDSEFAGMGSLVNVHARSIAKSFGVGGVPDAYPDAHGGVGQIVLGSGKRNATAAKVGGAKPNAKVGGGADEEVAWAKAHMNSTADLGNGITEKDVAADILKKRGAR